MQSEKSHTNNIMYFADKGCVRTWPNLYRYATVNGIRKKTNLCIYDFGLNFYTTSLRIWVKQRQLLLQIFTGYSRCHANKLKSPPLQSLPRESIINTGMSSTYQHQPKVLSACGYFNVTLSMRCVSSSACAWRALSRSSRASSSASMRLELYSNVSELTFK